MGSLKNVLSVHPKVVFRALRTEEVPIRGSKSLFSPCPGTLLRPHPFGPLCFSELPPAPWLWMVLQVLAILTAEEPAFAEGSSLKHPSRPMSHGGPRPRSPVVQPSSWDLGKLRGPVGEGRVHHMRLPVVAMNLQKGPSELPGAKVGH